MLTLNVGDNEEIYVGTREECRELWADKSKRGRIFLEDEFSALVLQDNKIVDKALAMKRKHPTTVITRQMVAGL